MTGRQNKIGHDMFLWHAKPSRTVILAWVNGKAYKGSQNLAGWKPITQVIREPI